jgi:predicted dehydrogenase/nucleoside-diphosphate-sugar epimerase
MSFSSNGEKVIGIIGCGLIADTHVEAIIDALTGAKIVLCDPLPGKAELLRQKYNLKAAYTNITEMLNREEPFSIHVASPPQLHVAHARQSLEAGCHVLVEKPLCFSRREAEELYDLAEKKGKTLCVDHSLLFQPSVVRMMNILQADSQIEVLHVNSFYGMDVGDAGGASLMQDWKRQMAGGFLMDSLVHPVTLAVTLAGSPSKIHANFVQKGEHIAEFIMSWQGASAVVSIGVSVGTQPFRRMTEVMTSAGTFTVDHSSEVLVFSGLGAGPRGFKKISKNLRYASQLALGTIGTCIDVLRRKIKQNPGARALIRAYYQNLLENGHLPISRKAVLDTVFALEVVGEIIEGRSMSANRKSLQSCSATSKDSPALTTLVTGASGFLGRNLCRELVASGKRKIIAVMRRGPNADRLASSPLLEKKFVDFNGLSAKEFENLLTGVDEVIHCAHASKAKTWMDYYDQNVKTTLALYKAAAANNCKRFIHLSSVAVYGLQNPQSKVVTENNPVQNKKRGWDFYVRSKSQADVCLTELATNGGPQLAILRPGILYAASGERLLSRSIPFGKERVFIQLGDGRNRLPFTRVEVLAKRICVMLDTAPFPVGTYNVTGLCDEPSREFRTRRLQALGVKARFLSLPVWPFRLLATTLELTSALLYRKNAPRITRYILDSATRDIIYDCSRAKTSFGWDPEEADRLAHHPS